MYLIEELKLNLAEALSKATGEDLLPEALEYPNFPKTATWRFRVFCWLKN